GTQSTSQPLIKRKSEDSTKPGRRLRLVRSGSIVNEIQFLTLRACCAHVETLRNIMPGLRAGHPRLLCGSKAWMAATTRAFTPVCRRALARARRLSDSE